MGESNIMNYYAQCLGRILSGAPRYPEAGETEMEAYRPVSYNYVAMAAAAIV